ncbi:MAG: glycosyltransferase [Bacteroidota bacterium]
MNYNGQTFLKQFLPSLLQHNIPNNQIHIADNGSTDDSIAWLKQHYPQLILHELGLNHGFAQGYNEALQQIEADYFVLLNSDVEVTANWLNPVIQLMEADRTIAAAQPKIRAFNNRSFFEHAGASGGWIDILGFTFCRGRLFVQVEKYQGQ